MSSSSSSSSEEHTAPDKHGTSTDGEDGDIVDSGQVPPQKYTLKQAFYKAYNTTPPKHENDMLLTEIPLEDKSKILEYYEYENNPSPH